MAGFNLTTTPTSLTLKPGETGMIVVVVSNRLGRPFLARVDPKVTPPSAAGWVVPQTVTQRQFDADPAATYNFEFKLPVPADGQPQKLQVRFDVVDPQVPDDPLAQGQTVAVDVVGADVVVKKTGKAIPWWVWLIAAVVLLGVGVGIYLLVRPKGGPVGPRQALPIAEVGAPAINCVYHPSCSVTVNDFTSEIVLPGTSGRGFLQSRTFPGSGTAPASGRFGYSYRVDITQLTGPADRCVTGLFLPSAAISDDLDYDGEGSRQESIYVVTSGGMGSVKLSAAATRGNGISFEFAEGLCPGATSFFFGFTSDREPASATATLRYDGGELQLPARAPR